MRKYLPVYLFIALLISCSGKTRVPRDVLSQKKMAPLLWDLFRADAFLTSFVLPFDSLKDKEGKTIRLYKEVFALHETNKEEFQRSFLFYEDHPVLMKELLDSVNAFGSSERLIPFKPKPVDSNKQKKISPVRVD